MANQEAVQPRRDKGDASTRYLLWSNIGDVLSIFFGVLLARPLGLPTHQSAIVLPLLDTHIVWVNLVTDGTPSMALAMDPADASSMSQPRPIGERIITGRMRRWIAIVGVVMAVIRRRPNQSSTNARSPASS